MKFVQRSIGLFLIVALLVGIGFVPTIDNYSTAQAQETTPRFEPSSCDFDMPEGFVDGESVECGFLIVPEDRSQPDSPTISLAVAIFKSTSENPSAPFIRLDGGPGGHSVGNFGPFLNQFSSTEPLLEKGDLVLIDQRGVGLSQPNLGCNESMDLTIELFDDVLPLDEEAELVSNAMQECRDRLVNDGVNLDAYNTAANAADIYDLWTTLGYEEINLYGVSYGTRLALEVMRDFPDGLRSVILDSTFPPQVDLYVDIGASAQRSLDILFEDCAAHENCNAAYPNLETTFYETVEQLNAEPVELTLVDFFTEESYSFLLTGDAFFELIFTSLYVTSILYILPVMISAAHDGDYFFTELLASAIFLDFSVDFGMYLSVQCYEEVHFQTPSEVEAASNELPDAIRFFASEDSPDIFELCSIWNVEKSSDLEEAPIESDIPTLIVSGRYDPITPPHYGQMTAETLSNSYFFEFPGMGHGVFDEHPCSLDISLQFLEDPTTAPDASCIEEDMRTPDFLVQ